MESRGWCETPPPSCLAADSTRRGPRCRPRPDSCRSWTRWSTTWREMRHRSPRPRACRGWSSAPVAPIPLGQRCSASTRANRISRRRRRRGREWRAAGARLAPRRRRVGSCDRHALMRLAFLIDRLSELPATRALAEALPAPGAGLGVAGLPGSSPAVLLATLARRLAQRVFVVIAATPSDAERWLADLQALVGDVAALYPQREAL